MTKVVIIVQARMGSTRLPGKVLMKVLGRPLLSYLIERLKKSKKADQLVVATTSDKKDQAIVQLCAQENVPVFLGSEEDVLDRYLQAAKHYHADVVVRITADCPLMDPALVDEAITFFLEHKDQFDYINNRTKTGYPIGMDVEVFSRQALEKAAKNADLQPEREHVTYTMYTHPQEYRVGSLIPRRKDLHATNYRLTVDTTEDFRLIERLIENLYPSSQNFTFDDILALLQKKPEWVQINAHVQQKKV